MSLKPVRNGCGNAARHLLDRRLAAEEVHRVLERAATGELERVEHAVGLEQPRHLEALVEPDPAGKPSAMFELGDAPPCRGPTASRTARVTWRGNSARLSTLPPHRSVRLLSPGLRNELSR